jgi:hypothetical protein
MGQAPALVPPPQNSLPVHWLIVVGVLIFIICFPGTKAGFQAPVALIY